MKKTTFTLLFLALLVSLAGCTTSVQISSTVQLAGFPDEYASYRLEIYVLEGTKVLNQKIHQTVEPGDNIETVLDVDVKAGSIIAYLFRAGQEMPEFFWRFDTSSTRTLYQSSFWLGYKEYVFQNKVQFVISDFLATALQDSVTDQLKFQEKPLYLFKIEDTGYTDIEINALVPQGSMYIQYGATLDTLKEPVLLTPKDGKHTAVIPAGTMGEVYILFKSQRIWKDNSLADISIKLTPIQ